MLKFISGACAALMALSAPFATTAMALPLTAPAWTPPAVINVQEDGRALMDPNWEENMRRAERRQNQERGKLQVERLDRGGDRRVQGDRWVQGRDRGGDRWVQGGDRRDRGEQRWDRGSDRWDRGMERRGGHAYWRGHRGYRDPRPGYRRHGDFWFPPAAFIAGAIIGGAIANQPPPRHDYRGHPHLEWCYARYRSYRSSDNTFQPYNGPRRQCRSPYG